MPKYISMNLLFILCCAPTWHGLGGRNNIQFRVNLHKEGVCTCRIACEWYNICNVVVQLSYFYWKSRVLCTQQEFKYNITLI
jgi:hypothetical protein